MGQGIITLIPIRLFPTVMSVDLRHFYIHQFEVIKLCVFLNMVGVAGARDYHHAFLEIPSKDALRRGSVVSRGDSGDDFIRRPGSKSPRPLIGIG